MEVSLLFAIFALDEERIWEMAIGHSQVYGNGIIAVDHFRRYARACHLVHGGNFLFRIADIRVGSHI